MVITRTDVMSRPKYIPYIMMATIIPSPWYESPATSIGNACSAGCVFAIADARVPTSIAGKIGKTQPGSTFVIT